MSPTVFRYKGYKFFFFSREEERIHVHVLCSEGEAKYWLDPSIVLAKQYGLSKKTLNEIEKIIKENAGEIRKAWKKHFGR